MLAQGRDGLGDVAYKRHQPEQTLLYQLVEAHYPALLNQLAQQGKSLPAHVHREFEAYLKCGRLEHGFLRVRCDTCHFERLVAFSCKKQGFCPSCGARRAEVWSIDPCPRTLVAARTTRCCDCVA